MAPRLALTYFDMPGRARVLRKALALGGVPFEDRALASVQIAALKPSLPYGMVPVLSIDEGAPGARVVAEAQAILRYIGRLTGAYPPASEPLACALVDELLDSFDDIYERLLMPTLQEDDAAVKRAMRENLVNADGGALHVALARIDARLAQLPAANAFLGAHAASVLLHELVVWDYATTLRSGHFDHIPTTFVDAFPTIVATFDKVARATSNSTPRDTAPSAAPKTVTSSKLKIKLMSLAADHDASAGPDRAEPLRLALRAASGLAFEETRVSRDAFRALQPTLPNGQLPVLEIDGHRYAQSQALLRLVGTLGGLYPADDARAAAQVDELLSHLNELYFFFDPVYQDSRPADKAGIRAALADDVVPESLAALDARLAQWQPGAGPFALGGAAPTVADVAIAALVAQLSGSPALAYLPRDVSAPHARVLAVSAALRDWIAKKAA